jgi:hypothetical protein
MSDPDHPDVLFASISISSSPNVTSTPSMKCCTRWQRVNTSGAPTYTFLSNLRMIASSRSSNRLVAAITTTLAVSLLSAVNGKLGDETHCWRLNFKWDSWRSISDNRRRDCVQSSELPRARASESNSASKGNIYIYIYIYQRKCKWSMYIS